MPERDQRGRYISSNFDSTLGEIAEAMRRKADAFYPALKRAFQKDGIRWVSGMQGSISGPLSLDKAKARGASLSSRQGASGLKGSFRYVVSGDKLDDLVLVKFSTKHYARVHEFGTIGAGGTMPDIVPVKARALAIPLRAAMTPAGVSRRPGPRDYDDLFVFSEPRGGFQDPNTVGYLARDLGDGELEFLYRLMSKVSIPPRLGMRSRHRADREKRTSDFGEAATKALSA